jgi:outer membrane protein OmpA-like peptidoglycan-associated protein
MMILAGLFVPVTALPSACMAPDQSDGAAPAETGQQETMTGHGSMNRLAEDIRAQIDDETFRITASTGGLRITADADALFAQGGETLSDAGRSELAMIADRLASGPGGTLAIIGHTDDRGDAAANEALSTRQAEAVSEVFRAAGIRDSFIQVIGSGESSPVAGNTSPEGRARNRRVDIVFRANIH